MKSARVMLRRVAALPQTLFRGGGGGGGGSSGGRDATALFQLPERWRGGRVEKLANYWRGVFTDYSEAAQEIVQGCRNRPRRAALLAAAAAGCVTAAGTNPDERDFTAALAERACLLGCVPDSIRNPESEAWQDRVWRLRNVESLRRWNLGLLSLMWEDNESNETGVYTAHCEYLKPGYFEPLVAA